MRSSSCLRELLEHAPDDLFVHDEEGRFVDVNRAACESTGYARDELLLLRLRDLVVGPDIEPGHSIWSAPLGVAITLETLHRRKDGGTIPIEARIKRCEIQGCVLFLRSARDVTERRRAERESARLQADLLRARKELRRGETRWKSALDASDSGVFDWDMGTGRVFYSSKWKTMLGVADAEVDEPIDEWAKRIHPDDRERVEREQQRHFAEQTDAYRCEYRMQMASGAWCWVLSRGRVVERDAAGAPVRFVGTHLDVTELHELTRALWNEKDRLELATRVSGVGIWEADRSSLELHCDDRMCEMYGVEAGAFDRDKTLWDQCLHPDDREVAVAEWLRCVREGTDYDAEFRIVHQATGETRYIRSLATFVRDPIVGVDWDLTEERLASSRLRRAKEEAEAGERAKSAFIATISHELRTPMNGVMVMAELLLQSRLDDAQQEMIALMQRSGRDLLVLIDDLLDYSKFEAGKMRLAPAPFDLCSCIEGIAQALAVQAQQKGLELWCDIQLPRGTVLRGDADRIRQVVTNLIGNAIKFTDAGSVSVWLVGRDDGTNVAFRVEVRDTGIGIEASMQARLFQPFSQADQSDQRRHGGTGLGLVISRQLARAMGGDLSFDSEVGRGSTFRFELTLPRASLPARPVVSAPAVTHSPLRYRALSLLLVEDNEISRRVGTLLLERSGHEVTVAETGEVALRLLAERTFDCVLMDCQMPELDGYETTRRLRRGSTPNAIVPVIALTASGMPGDRERCLAAGMNDYALKPLQRDQLSAAFLRCGLVLVRRAVASFDQLGFIDALRGVQMVNGESLIAHVARLLVRQMPERFHDLFQLVRAPSESSAQRAADLAHKMAGSAASIGAEELRERLHAVERAAARGPVELERAIVLAEEVWKSLEPHIAALVAGA